MNAPEDRRPVAQAGHHPQDAGERAVLRLLADRELDSVHSLRIAL